MPNRQSGFTLVEILVAISLSVMLIVAAMGLFFSTLLSNTKKTVLSTIKDEGDYAINQMEFLMRNAISLEQPTDGGSICAPGRNRIAIKSLDNSITELSIQNSRIASASTNLATNRTVFLTSDDVQLSNLRFDCQNAGPFSGTFIKVSFTLRKQAVEQTGQPTTSEDFSTSVNVRSL